MGEGFKDRHKSDLAAASLWIAVAGTVFSMLGFGFAIFGARADSRFWYVAISSSVYTLALLALVVYMAWTSRQDARRIEQMVAQVQSVRSEAEDLNGRLATEVSQLSSLEKSFSDLHQIAHDFRDEMAKQHEGGHFVDKAFFVKALDTLKALFDGITGNPCSLCIKVFVDENRMLKTLCRDSRSAPTRGAKDETTAFSVDANTDFTLIMKGIRRWWFSNDLASEKNYLNENAKFLEHYRSTIVVPIKWMGAQDTVYYQGFLCLDSQESNAFNEDYHPYLLGAVGDILQPLLEIYRQNMMKVQPPEAANA